METQRMGLKSSSSKNETEIKNGNIIDGQIREVNEDMPATDQHTKCRAKVQIST